MHTIAHHEPTLATRERVRTLLTRDRVFVYLAALLLAAMLVTAQAHENTTVSPTDDRPLVLPER
jgi:hypothetical protein